MFRWIERGEDLELELESESEEGVFIDALEALRELLEEDADTALGPTADHRVTAAGDSRGVLLADWLRELAALAQGDGFVPERITALSLTDGGLTATVEGSCGAASLPVRTVSQDGLLYEPASDSHRLHARVVFTTRESAEAGAGGG